MSVRPNQYADTCYRCGERVEAGQGVFEYERSPGVRWPEGRFQRDWPLVEHHECRAKYAGTDVHYRYNPEARHEDS